MMLKVMKDCEPDVYKMYEDAVKRRERERKSIYFYMEVC